MTDSNAWLRSMTICNMLCIAMTMTKHMNIAMTKHSTKKGCMWTDNCAWLRSTASYIRMCSIICYIYLYIYMWIDSIAVDCHQAVCNKIV